MELVLSCGFLLLGSLAVLCFAHNGMFTLLAGIAFLLAFVPLMLQCLRFWGRLWKEGVQSGAAESQPKGNSTNQFPERPQ